MQQQIVNGFLTIRDQLNIMRQNTKDLVGFLEGHGNSDTPKQAVHSPNKCCQLFKCYRGCSSCLKYKKGKQLEPLSPSQLFKTYNHKLALSVFNTNVPDKIYKKSE